jgi:ELWxxDGT repeat protein
MVPLSWEEVILGLFLIRLTLNKSRMKKNLVFVGLLLAQLYATGQMVNLVKDINTAGNQSSSPSLFTQVGLDVFFTATTAVLGNELWKTFTASSADLVKDIRPGKNGSNPQDLINMSGTVYFSADDGIHGRELWKSNGTTAGTVLVKDIRPGNDPSNVEQLVDLSGTLIFAALDVSGVEIWKSDGTSAGTVRVTDINTGGSSNPTSLTLGGSFVYFSANDPTNGPALWKTDGTTTTLLRANLQISSMAYVGTTMFFSADDGINGVELWKSDGTAAGTMLVTNVVAGSGSSSPHYLVDGGGTLYFQASTAGEGTEVWKSNGTAAGTAMVADLLAGASSGASHPMAFAGGNLFFQGYDGTRQGLWRSQGTLATTVFLNQVSASIGFSTWGTSVFFAGDNAYGRELWKSDGTPAGTEMVRDIYAGPNGSIYGGLGLGPAGNVFLAADNGINGIELWKSDGTGVRTELVQDINTANSNGSIRIGAILNNVYYFSADNSTNGLELWRTDGTPAGTWLVKDINPGAPRALLNSQIASNGTVVFFAAQDNTSIGEELWRSDGTGAGTVLVKDIYTSSQSSAPRGFYNIGTLVYFEASDADGRDLWRSDGTSVGTFRVKNINPTVGASSNIENFTEVNGILFFTANNGTNGKELWKSDGTELGTVMVKDIHPTGSNGAFNFIGTGLLTNVNGTLFFVANDGTGNHLWKSDGTTGGTVKVTTTFLNPSYLVNYNNTLYFSDNGRLCKSDGTNLGTVAVTPSAGIVKLTVAGNTLYFLGVDSNGYELWKSDGTTAGTALVKDIFVGSAGQVSSQVQLSNINGTLYFNPLDGIGNFIYKTNGTLAGTIRARSGGEYYSAFVDPTPFYLNKKVIFVASHATYGDELFSVVAEPISQPTAFLPSLVTATSFAVGFTPPSIVPDGYLAIRKIGSSPTGIPIDGPAYGIGSGVGDGTVAYVGTTPSFSQSGLTGNTHYFYDIFAYNYDGVAYVYRPYSPLEGSVNTLYPAPANQPTLLSFASVTTTSFNISFTAATGTPDGYLVVRRTGASPTGAPTPGVSYSVNQAIGDGTVVFSGATTALPIAQTLTSGTQYFYDVFSFNGSGTLINYLTTAPLKGNQFTLHAEPTVQATNISFSSLNSTSLTVNWVNGNGGERILVGSATTAVSVSPVDGTDYVASLNFTAATDVGSGNKVLYKGNGSTASITNLSPNTTYHFRVFELNGSGQSINYFTTTATGNPASRTTLATEPSAQPTGLSFSLHTTSGFRLNFTAASGAPTGYLIIRKAGSATTGVPVDGTTYTVGDALDGTIVAIGNLTQFDDSGLSAGTTYYYTIFSFNGSGPAINYLTTVAGNSGFTITLPIAPTIQTVSSIGQTSFTANWSTATGAASYQLDVSSDNFVSFVTNYNSKSVNATTEVITGLSPGTTYQYRVRAVNGFGGVSADSNPMGSQLTIPPTPIGLAFSNVEQTQFTLSWTPSASATEYHLFVSENASFSPLLAGYTPKIIAVPTETVTGLTPGNTYYVKVQAKNNGGGALSPESNPESKQLKPATPVAIDAANILSATFKAKWNAANGASGYEIDVSLLNDFSTHVSGYPTALGNVLELTVASLQSSTTYFYRVRAKNTTGDSPYSNTVSVTTGSAGSAVIQITEPIAAPDLPSGQPSITVTAEVANGNGAKTVQLFYRKITSTGAYSSVAMSNSIGSTFTGSVSASAFDELGIEFYIHASDLSGTDQTVLYYSYQSFSASSSQAIPSIVRFGGTQQSYQIISIPFALSSNKIEDIFEPVVELGAYNKAKWRLVRYQNEKNTDYQDGISTIDLGKSYWFNSVSQVTVKPPAGTSPKYNQSSPFKLELMQGWNQIATPYPFNVDWDDILAANGNPSSVGKYKTFNSGALGFDESNLLKSYEGGFVFVNNASGAILDVPVTLKNTAGGRRANKDWSKNIDHEEWLLPITLVQGEAVNQLGSVGMHPNASPSMDEWDDVTLPRFIQYLEGNFYHPEFFWPKFSRDVVPTTPDHEWSLSVESNGEGPITLTWDAKAISNSSADLFLYDPVQARLINMKAQGFYTLSSSSRSDLRIAFTHSGDYVPDQTRLGNVWPNPARSEVTLSFALSREAAFYHVSVDLYDMKGAKLISLGEKEYKAGVHNVQWDLKDANGNDVSSALYIAKLKVNGRYNPDYSKVIVDRNH